MKTPSMPDIIKGIYDRLDNTEIEVTDSEDGDEENTNVTIPAIGTLTGTVSYYADAFTKAPLARITWEWTEPLMYDETGTVVDPDDPDIADDIFLDPVVDYRFGYAINPTDPVTFRTTKGSRTVVTEGHALGLNVTATVYAVTRSGITGPTISAAAIVSRDTTAPLKPNAPVVSVYLGALIVRDNGKDYLGNDMATDTAYKEVQISVDEVSWSTVGRIGNVGTLTLSNLTYDVLHYIRLVAYDYSGNMSTASDSTSGIPRQLVDADVGDGEIKAYHIAAHQIQANHLEATLILTTEVLTGPAAETHTRLSPEGLQAFVVGPSGTLVPVLQFVSGAEDLFAISDVDGNKVASITGAGLGTFKLLAADDLELGGISMDELLDGLPHGLIARSSKAADLASIGSTETAYREFRAVLPKNRQLRFKLPEFYAVAGTAGCITHYNIRVAYDGAVVSTSSALFASTRVYHDTTYQTKVPGIEVSFDTSAQTEDLREVRFLLSAYRATGSGTFTIKSSVEATTPVIMMLFDDGLPLTDSGVDNDTITYTSVWQADHVYDDGGTDRLGDGGFLIGHTFDDRWAQAVFTGNAISGETTKTIATALSGATLVKAELACTLAPDGESSLISQKIRANTYTAYNAAAPSGTAVSISKTTTSQWRAWHDITLAFTTAMRGAWLGGADTPGAYLFADSGTDSVKLRLTYQR